MGISYGYTCRNCRMSMYSDIQGKCCECGKDFGKNNIEVQCYFCFVICIILFIVATIQIF